MPRAEDDCHNVLPSLLTMLAYTPELGRPNNASNSLEGISILLSLTSAAANRAYSWLVNLSRSALSLLSINALLRAVAVKVIKISNTAVALKMIRRLSESFLIVITGCQVKVNCRTG